MSGQSQWWSVILLILNVEPSEFFMLPVTPPDYIRATERPMLTDTGQVPPIDRQPRMDGQSFATRLI